MLKCTKALSFYPTVLAQPLRLINSVQGQNIKVRTRMVPGGSRRSLHRSRITSNQRPEVFWDPGRHFAVAQENRKRQPRQANADRQDGRKSTWTTTLRSGQSLFSFSLLVSPGKAQPNLQQSK